MLDKFPIFFTLVNLNILRNFALHVAQSGRSEHHEYSQTLKQIVSQSQIDLNAILTYKNASIFERGYNTALLHRDNIAVNNLS